MATKKKKQSVEISRKEFIQTGSAGVMALPFLGLPKDENSGIPEKNLLFNVEPEWRNRQPGMSYRQLGRTGFMVSEIVNGGMPVVRDTGPAEMAIEMGLNYLDCAQAYGRGEAESNLGRLFARSSIREKVFLTTKVSNFPNYRNAAYREIFNGLPQAKKDALMKKAMEMRAERGVERPEYYVTYFNGQDKQLDGLYLSNAMMEEYGEQVEGSTAIEQQIIESVEESLKRLNTDYVDILMCPHAANSSEEVYNPCTLRAFEKLKKQGKARFLGVSSHSDMAGVLKAAIDTGYYDMAMIAYNIINHGYLDEVVKDAYHSGIGIVAMKAANPVTTNNPETDPVPRWRLEKLNHFVPGDLKAPQKGYLWVLQNPHIAAVISNMFSLDSVKENLAMVGKKIETLPA
jgi:aryl-alcohol dehydrogenase-like predicted oxidoreductase